ncbi:HAMP domain-containing histidine kinase [Caenimonas sedimenti]|uniref:histidine kinase n=1 Tax=Caenimonas sedimenti TaxID=2596921 RepID=A0A562ZJZ8_9BURK|nr:HAMP domain-containing sensor histidine kinase [Caenimonas sedimenti]TWO68717.1 HAMP domain-containing histidine kinase [Caenimonas sedimenti]
MTVPACEAAALRIENESLRLELARVTAAGRDAHLRQLSFLATIAHELRNPLMPLRLAALMLDGARNDDVAYAKHQATIKGQVAQITRLIGDLLEGSSIGAGKFRLERKLLDVGTVLDRVAETCQLSMDTRHQHFSVKRDPGALMVLGDAARLTQVFGNLLENSSRYTPEGGEISLSAATVGDCVVIAVKDNGIGITAQALPHVFDIFVRDARATMVNEIGLGVGLSVVRELVKAHEGGVVAHCAGEDAGSEFIVRLPIALANTRLSAVVQ